MIFLYDGIFAAQQIFGFYLVIYKGSHICCSVNMGKTMNQSEIHIVARLVDTLNALPQSCASAPDETGSGPDAGYDFRVAANIAGKPVMLLIEVKRHVYPRDVQQYVFELGFAMGRSPETFKSAIPLLVADAISPGARKSLRESGQAYFDGGGSLFIIGNGLLIDRERPPTPAQERTFGTPFAGSRARVSLALLNQPKKWVTVKQLSSETAVSPATASEVLQAMERNEWVITRGAGPNKRRCLVSPGAALDAWAKYIEPQKAPKQHQYYVSDTTLDMSYRIPKILEKHNVPYAVTGEAAAQHYVPWLTDVPVLRLRMPYSDSARSALGELGARSVTQGANLIILEESSPADMPPHHLEDGTWYAEPIQVYLDLLKMEGRARDAAAHLREERIGF
jgi:hypothetical protein